MSITKEAIEHLQKAQNTSSANEAANEAIGNGGLVFIPESMHRHDLEKFMPNRRSFRGELDTNSIPDYAGYLNEHGIFGDGAVFIDQESMTAKAVFDLGDSEKPLHGDHIANLRLKISASFNRLSDNHNQVLSQRRFAEYLEDSAHIITCYSSDGTELKTPGAVESVRKVDVESIRKNGSEESALRSERSALESIAVQNAEQMPVFIDFRLTPYAGLSERVIRCRIAFHTGDEVKFIPEIINMDELMEEIAQEFTTVLTNEVGDSSGEPQIYIGTFNM